MSTSIWPSTVLVKCNCLFSQTIFHFAKKSCWKKCEWAVLTLEGLFSQYRIGTGDPLILFLRPDFVFFTILYQFLFGEFEVWIIWNKFAGPEHFKLFMLHCRWKCFKLVTKDKSVSTEAMATPRSYYARPNIVKITGKIALGSLTKYLLVLGIKIISDAYVFNVNIFGSHAIFNII